MAMGDPVVLTFVTSLRHFDTTDDYPRVEELLADTLRSLDAQTDRRCRAVVVANRAFIVPTDITMPVEVVLVDFPAPPHWAASKLPREAGVRLDKGAKLAVAVSRVSQGHVMYVDADDVVSRRLVAFAAANTDRSGWFVEHGIRYDVASGLYRSLPGFEGICGTSLIFARSLLPPMDIPANASRDDVMAIVGEDRLLYELGSHRHLRERFNLEPLPFPGAGYCVNNGQNVSSQPRLSIGWPMSAALAAEFGIRRRHPAAMWRAVAVSFGPAAGRAVQRRLRRAQAAGRRGLHRLFRGERTTTGTP